LTHSYLVGAISGTTMIVAAVVAFVMIVSLQTLQDWPISGFGLGPGKGERSGAKRAHGTGTPTPSQTAAAARSTSPPGATQAPIIAAATAHDGRAGLGGGSEVGGHTKGAGDVSTGAPTAVTPSPGSGPSSDAGVPAPVGSSGAESTGASSGSGTKEDKGVDSGPGSHSALGVKDGPSDESAATPTEQAPGAASAASESSDEDQGSHGGPEKTAESPGQASIKSKPPKSKPPETKQAKSTPPQAEAAPEPAAAEATPPPAAADEGAGKQPGAHSHGGPGGRK
jgi:hypothetical protein